MLLAFQTLLCGATLGAQSWADSRTWSLMGEMEYVPIMHEAHGSLEDGASGFEYSGKGWQRVESKCEGWRRS